MFEFDEEFTQLEKKAQSRCKEQFCLANQNFEANQKKVLKAFIKNKVSSNHLSGSTGYGYGDAGRETIERVYADVFGSESALVRHTFTCGTHALATCLFGILRPGDRLLCVTGEPYDSMVEVIGLRGEGGGSLKDFGILYSQIELKEGNLDFEEIKSQSRGAKVVYLQKSCGYSHRNSIDVKQIARLVEIVKNEAPDAVILVDNCYGEFVAKQEPCEVGADLCVGSLIKNPGGGIARTGGYIVGRKDLVGLCANRLTAPGLGAEVGCSLNLNRELLLGLFLAPQAVLNAVKSAIFCASLFDLLGFETLPKWNEPRSDVVQGVILKSRENLKAFCRGVQAASPIDSFVIPEDWDMPGYSDQIIMAAGTFTMGATIESSADGPIKEPFIAFFQGGLTFLSGKLCVMEAAWRVCNEPSSRK